MADTISDIEITVGDWIDVSVLTGIAVGSGLIIQNKGTSPVICWIGETKPLTTSYNGPVVFDYPNTPSSVTISSGENKVWLRVDTQEGLVNIQQV